MGNCAHIYLWLNVRSYLLQLRLNVRSYLLQLRLNVRSFTIVKIECTIHIDCNKDGMYDHFDHTKG